MIREACREDLPTLMEMERGCFADDRFSRERYAYLMVKANSLVLVHEGQRVDGSLVILFRRGSSHARLYSICVDPSHRAHGVARALIGEGESRARVRGVKRLGLEVRVGNLVARRLYGSLGYRDVAVLPGYYGDEDGVKMEKMLTDPIVL